MVEVQGKRPDPWRVNVLLPATRIVKIFEKKDTG